MKKNYFVALLALFVNLATAQQILFEPTTYRGAFAPGTAQWTDSWAQFNPLTAAYPNDATGTTTLPVVLVSGNITASTTWTADKVYELTTTVFVKNNATLTIAPGTFIRSKTIGASLVITRGAKLNAIGTASAPIVFTSKANSGQRNRGDWGGIVLLGRAAYNVNSGVNYVEGISQTSDTQFGGGTSPVNNDDSGTLKYVRIEFAGFAFSPNNELNGLTMGAVGSGTDIDYVQVSYSNDDAFEWFGGSVDCKHLIALGTLDDDFDTDNGYSGRVQFGLCIKDPEAADASTSECFESDNNASGTAVSPYTSAIFTNFTCLGPVRRAALSTPTLTVNTFHDKAARIRRASQIKIFNSLFLDFKTGVRFEDLSAGYFATDGTAKWKNNITSVLNNTQLISGPGNEATTALISTTGSTTTNATIAAAFISAANANTTTVLTTSTTTGASAILETPYPVGGTSGQLTYAGLDYRPKSGSIAESGASFTDAVFTGILANTGTLPSVIASITYCQGAPVSPLTAVAAPGGTLNWYTGATGGTPSATPPTVSNTATRTYYVSQTIAGVESGRAAIVVTIIPGPTTVLGAITSNGTATAITNITALVGTTTTTTYQIPTVTLPTGQSLLWTVPGGTVITGGQGTNSITVRFDFVNAGGGAYGNISVRVVNAETGCTGTAKSVSLTSALPAAVTFKMYNDPIQYTTAATPAAIARTSFGEYMGTPAVLKLVATPPATTTATSYVWELPAGVNLDNLGTVSGTPTTKNYVTYPFVTSVSLPTANVASSANRTFFIVTRTLYTSGVTIETAVQRVYNVGALTFTDTPVTSVITIGTENLSLNPAFPIISTTLPEIKINFTALTDADHTYDYTTTATGVITDALRLGLKTRNGVGVSFTNNATLAINGSTSVTSPALLSGSTASLLTLTSTRPAAPSAVKLTNPAFSGAAATTAITVISKYIGTTTELLLTATPSVLATSYEWELPTWVNIVSGATTTLGVTSGTSNVIRVNFAGNQTLAAPTGATSYYLGVKAKNGLGSSSTNNATLTPSANGSTAKLLKVTTSLPAAAGTVTGQIAYLCPGQTVNYTFIASPLANTYTITAPANCRVTSSSNPNNVGNVLTSSSDLNFTVEYPTPFVITTSQTANKTITIQSENGVGNSLTNKVLALDTKALTAVGANTNSYVNPNTGTAGVTLFGKCATQTISVPRVTGATSYVWTLQNGAVIVGNDSSFQVTIDFSQVDTPTSTTTNIVKVKAQNACNSTVDKSITLTWDGIDLALCPDSGTNKQTDPIAVASNVSQIYPNPVADTFSIDLSTTLGSEVSLTIYAINGAIVKTSKVQLVEGFNTVSEDVSNLGEGIYFVKLYNATNNETIVRKLVKR